MTDLVDPLRNVNLASRRLSAFLWRNCQLRTEETHTTYTNEPVANDVHQSSTVTYAPSGAGMIERLIIWIFGIIQSLIVLRIVLLLFAARDANPIVSFVYSITDLLVAPFRGIFGINEIAAGATALTSRHWSPSSAGRSSSW